MIADEATLARLMAMAQNGDRQAYAALLSACSQWLMRFYRRRVAPHACDDLVQETLMSLHQKLASYDPERPFLPWLAAIARYRWVDHLRKLYRADETGFDIEPVAPSDEPAIAARISLARLFQYLSPAQARAIELVKIEGLSVAQAAVACGQSESLVKVNIHRGLKKLAALIEKD